MGKQRSRADKSTLAVNLPQLQNLIKRDSQSYASEFAQQLRHLDAQLHIAARSPHTPPAKQLPELLSFVAQTVPSYASTSAPARAVPATLVALLQASATAMHPDLRRALVSAVIHLHNRSAIDSLAVLPLFFHLFRCRDKMLREQLHAFIVQDIKHANAKTQNNKLNRTVQNLLYSIITPPPGYVLPAASTTVSSSAAGATASSGPSDDADAATGFSPSAAQNSLLICIELYKKQLWTDAKTVNVIADACFSPVTKIMSTAVHFFINADTKEETNDMDSDEEAAMRSGVHDTQAMEKANHMAHINKKSKANARKLNKAIIAAKRSSKPNRGGDTSNGSVHFSALALVYDPQAFAEKLFSKVKAAHLAFDTKLLMLNLVSRMIASHKLFVLPFYSYLQKYLQPHQRNVTALLSYMAQAAHDLIPPDVLYPVVRAIADAFVSDHASREVISAGINSIRELCARAPLSMDADLLSDLVQFKDHRDKSVVMAARSLIGLYREVNPSLLPKSERGKIASMAMQDGAAPTIEFGRVRAASRIAGADLLAAAMLEDGENATHDDGDDAAWEAFSDSDDDGSDSDDGEWHNVDENDEMIRLSDFSSDSDSSDSDSDADDENMDVDAETGDAPPTLVAEDPNALPIEATRFLTPADFKRMAELRSAAAKEAPVGKAAKRQRAVALLKERAATVGSTVSQYVDELDLVPLRKKPKSDYEARMASVAAGREGREKYGSRKGNNETKATSNREKRITKDFTMVSKSRRISGKKKISLREKTRALRKHIDKQKKQM
ncbi:SDA1-domain-containing protein [Blastocladiella britannica]|nr:SDA1-domain-containing protein [Blastocladiella britannica]